VFGIQGDNDVLQFPGYLKEHAELPDDEKRRHQSQYESISKIIAIFDNPGYKEDDPRVVGLMTEVRARSSLKTSTHLLYR